MYVFIQQSLSVCVTWEAEGLHIGAHLSIMLAAFDVKALADKLHMRTHKSLCRDEMLAGQSGSCVGENFLKIHGRVWRPFLGDMFAGKRHLHDS